MQQILIPPQTAQMRPTRNGEAGAKPACWCRLLHRPRTDRTSKYVGATDDVYRCGSLHDCVRLRLDRRYIARNIDVLGGRESEWRILGVIFGNQGQPDSANADAHCELVDKASTHRTRPRVPAPKI